MPDMLMPEAPLPEAGASAPLYPVADSGALIIAASDRLMALRHLVEASGVRLLGAVTPENATARLADQINLDLLLFDAGGLSSDVAADSAAAVARLIAERDCRTIVLLDAAVIDAVAGPMLAANAILLCDASPAEAAAVLTEASAPRGSRLHDATREREAERLRLLNEEVARLAEVLTQLTAEPPGGVRDRTPGYRGEPVVEPDPDPRAIRATIRARRLRDQHFAAELFADPAWDMLLDLYAARLEGRRVSVSSLCIAASVPPTTALRWIGTMHDADLFGREPDPTDKRRAHITLTDRAAAAMRGYFGAAGRAGLVPA
jgi:DNA-binding MarR family transcriptional regulator